MEDVTPAEGANPQATETTPTAETTQAQSAPVASTESASTPEAPAAATPKPDIASLLADPELRQTLLKDPEFRREIFKHPETAQEMEHRIASEAGRRAKEQLERLQQQEQLRLERERLKGMDEYELGVQKKRELEQQEAEEALQARLAPYQSEVQAQIYFQTGNTLMTAAQKLAAEAGVAKEEIEKLVPQNFKSLEDYYAATVSAIVESKAAQRAKELAKPLIEAGVLERLGQQSDSTPSPATLPAAEAAIGDSEFLASFSSLARPSKADYERARRLTGR